MVSRLLRPLWRENRGALWAFELDGTLVPEAGLDGYHSRPVRPEEAPALARAMGGAPDDVARRLADGQRCFATFADGEIVAYGWVARARVDVPEQEGWVEPGPAEAYIFECATLPAHRGRGLYPTLLRHIAAALGDAGVRRCWIGADADNVASQRGIEQAGFRRAADVSFRRVLGRRRLDIRPASGAPAALVQGARQLMH